MNINGIEIITDELESVKIFQSLEPSEALKALMQTRERHSKEGGDRFMQALKALIDIKLGSVSASMSGIEHLEPEASEILKELNRLEKK